MRDWLWRMARRQYWRSLTWPWWRYWPSRSSAWNYRRMALIRKVVFAFWRLSKSQKSRECWYRITIYACWDLPKGHFPPRYPGSETKVISVRVSWEHLLSIIFNIILRDIFIMGQFTVSFWVLIWKRCCWPGRRWAICDLPIDSFATFLDISCCFGFSMN